MVITMNHHHYLHGGVQEQQITALLTQLLTKEAKTMATAQETLDAVNELAGKVNAFPDIVNKLEQDIRDAIAASAGVPADVQAALDAAFTAAKAASGVADAAAADAADGVNDAVVDPVPVVTP